ncbi:MAG: UvrD-helicase domain-containing protein [Campylobacterales bacterium]
MEFLEELNEAQREAVTYIDGPLLVLAGAGSGKTKTITSRLAYLLALGIDPTTTLTLTFTNKAAKEMRERALSLIGTTPYAPPLLATFHKFGLMFLKRYIHLLGRKPDFIIIDTDDQRKILKELGGDLFIPAQLQKEISRYKNSLVTPEDVILLEEKRSKVIGKIYRKYQQYLKEKNLVDFDDLLLLTYTILKKDSELAQSISTQYQYIMVDEYQDTNQLQLQILKLLCTNHKNICVVGDDDQAIYGFRGASHQNILNFEEEFGAKVIQLKINYRSREPILRSANRLISFNRNRYRKELEAFRGEGKEVEYLEFPNERGEAVEIAKRIKKLIGRGVDPGKIAVLYRINALSRGLEEGFRSEKLPYKLVGGTKFYEREEIKDLISYLRLIANPEDDYSFLRIVNKPRRGIGKATIDKLKAQKGEEHFLPFIWRDPLQFLPPKPKHQLKKFGEFIKKLQQKSLEEIPEVLEEELQFSESYQNEEKALNIEEFYGKIRESKGLEIGEFLNELSLENEQDKVGGRLINMMTIHAAKGLEFDYLFVIGWEEGYFPLENGDVEEERRLAYVAITRAREELVLTSVRSRLLHGRRKEMERSRFLTEAGIVKEGRVLHSRGTSAQGGRFKVGDFVAHPVFGKGRVIGINRAGRNFRLVIDFGGNRKEVLSNFVKKI